MRYFLRHPLVTEKNTVLASRGQYVFLVDREANAPQVRMAIKARYRVDAVRVNFVNVKAKMRRLGRSVGTKPGYKKAIVWLKEGQKLDIMPH